MLSYNQRTVLARISAHGAKYSVNSIQPHTLALINYDGATRPVLKIDCVHMRIDL